MYRIRIKKAPVMARGGSATGSRFGMGDQLGHGLFVAGGLPLAPSRGGGLGSVEASGMGNGLRSFVPEVPRELANIEAERGETIMGDFDQDGQQEHMAVGGRRHAQGGTPLQVPEDSFIFSDTRKLKIGGPVLQEFGKSASTKKKYTPAELAKQYDLNRYKEILNDPDVDPYTKKTAALMLQNNQQKLAKLALYQEGLKGFPQGIPSMALPLVQGMMAGVGSQEEGVERQLGAPETGPSPEARDDGLPAGMPIAQDGYWMRPHEPSQVGWGFPVRQVAVPVPPPQQRVYVAPASPWNPYTLPPPPPPRDPVHIQPQHPYARQAAPIMPWTTAPWNVGTQPVPAQPQAASSFVSSQAPWDLPASRSYYIQQQPAPNVSQLPPLPSGPRPWDFPVVPAQPQAASSFVSSQAPWDLPAAPQQGFSFRDNPGGSGMVTTNVLASQGTGPRRASGAATGQNTASATSDIPSWFKLWTKSNTPEGSRSPTGKSTVYDPSQGNSLYDDYRYWSSVAGRPFKDAKDYQSFVYNQVRKGGTDALFKMWSDYGLTRAGSANPDDPDWGFADGYFGARTAALSHWRPKPDVPAGTKPEDPEDKSQTPTQTKQDKPADYPKPGNPGWQMGSPDWMPWWQQDKINLGAAYKNRYDLQKYMPTLVSSDVVLPNAVYYDPTRSVAATQGSAALQHMMNMAYGRPQLGRSIQSNISGQEYGQVGNTLADFANRNVAVGNQSATVRAGLQNEHSRFKSGLLDAYMKGNTIANQQWDNAVRMMDNDIRKNYLSGVTNAQKTYWMNRLNPYYSINPGSGQLFFKQGKALSAPAMGSMTGSDPLSLYNSYVQQYMDKVQGADRKSAQEFALRAAFANKSQYGVDSDGDSRMSMSGMGYDPRMMAYLQSSMSQFGM